MAKTQPALAEILQNPAIWRVGQLPASVKHAIPTGFTALDRALPARGWEKGAMSEILTNDQGIGELSILAPAFRNTTQQGGNVVIAGIPHLPFPHAWESAGISLNRVLLLGAEGSNLLWALEQAARSSACGMVVAWTTTCRKELTYQALRRLHVAAETGGTTLILFRPENIIDQSSPAPTRIALKGMLGELRLRILKRRGALLAETIVVNVYPPHWQRPTLEQAAPALAQRRSQAVEIGAMISSANQVPLRRLSASR